MKLFNPNSPQVRVSTPPIVAQIPPPTSGPRALQYPIGTIWIDSITNIVYVLTSFADGEAVWVDTVPASAGVLTSLTVNPGPTAITGEFRVNATVNEAEVIRLHENGGPAGTIEIASLQGTGSDSISIQSVGGGIQIATDAPSKNIILSSSLGSIGMVAGEDTQDAFIIQADGGTSSGLLIENTSGTGAGSSTTSAIGVLATDGAVYVESRGAFSGAIVLDASDAAGGLSINSGSNGISLATTGSISASATLGNIDITADAGDVNIEATAGDINFTMGGSLNWNVAGAINLDAASSSHFTVTGAGEDVIISSVGGSAFIEADEAVVNAITIDALNAAGGIDINAGTGGIAVDTTGVLSLDAAGVTNLTTTGAFDLTVNSTAGSVVINGGEAVADAIQLTAGNAAGGVRIASGAAGTGGVTLVGGTTGNIKLTNVQVAAAAGPSATVTVVNNSRVGSCTFSGYTQAASATLVLTLTNSFITATSPVIASVQNAGTNDAQMQITRIKQGSGTADITIKNQGAAALNGDMVMSFIVLA